MSDVPSSAPARLRLSFSLVIGGALSLAFLAMALASFVFTPYDPLAIETAAKFSAPSTAHLLGTDQYGRDVLSQIMVGARNSIAVALLAVGIGAGVGVPLGLLASIARGLFDEVISRTNDLVFAFPALLLAILFTAAFGPGIFNAIVAIGIYNVPVFARLVRGAAIQIWPRNFILAARTAGRGPLQIAAVHVLPNIANLLIVQCTIQFSLGILAEAGLSYVGLGAPPPSPSWGRMLAESQTLVALAPWLAIFPGLAIFLSVLGLNLLGDGLRDRLDPRFQEGA